jgi:hypothetical protein
MDPDVGALLPGGYLLTLNRRVWLVVLPHLPSRLDPVAYRGELTTPRDLDEAAWQVLSTTDLVVGPSPHDGHDLVELRYPGPPDACSVFRFARPEFERLVDDVATHAARQPLDGIALHDLAAGALRRFLEDELPRAGALDESDRTLLGLGAAQKAVIR